MKHRIKVTILVCMVTVLLSTLSLQTAEAKIPFSGGGCLACQELAGVAAVSATDVWAVGYYYNSSSQAVTLIEHWNGTSWSVVKSPNIGSGANDLYSVAATSATGVRAVGGYYYNSKKEFLTLTERWNGTKWSVVKSPH